MKYFDAKLETQNCIEWIKNWFDNESGNAKGVIIGISGGKDSTVVAALLCKALGRDRVFGVLMPNGNQHDIDDSKQICKLLFIDYVVVNIDQVYTSILDCITKEGIGISAHTKTNIPPRIRMTALYAIGQEKGYRVAGTGNLSERYIGYSTKWGDTANDFNPIANFVTDEVIAIGRELDLPAELIEKTPEDGLSGKTDEENLGFTYKQLNKYIRTGICEDKEVKLKIDKLHKYNTHKQNPIMIYIPKL